MTALNLFAQLLTEDYPALYMMKSEMMSEARKRGGLFEGVVGRLEADKETGVSYFPLISPEEDLGAWAVESTSDTGSSILKLRMPVPDGNTTDRDRCMDLTDLTMSSVEQLSTQALSCANTFETQERAPISDLGEVSSRLPRFARNVVAMNTFASDALTRNLRGHSNAGNDVLNAMLSPSAHTRRYARQAEQPLTV